MGVPISSFTFENVDYEIKDAVARDAMASLNGFKYSICSTTENTPSGVSFTDSDTGFTVTGALAASSSTKNMIYLVPANGGEAKNVYEEYITVELTKTVDNAETTVYQWEKIGSTAIDLNGYLTTDDAAAFAPKNAPVFTGSISMGRVEGSTVGANSVAVGNNVIASGRSSHAEGGGEEDWYSWPSWEPNTNYAVGDKVERGPFGPEYDYYWYECITAHTSTADFNSDSANWKQINEHGEWRTDATTASGMYSHAEGMSTKATGDWAHAEGSNTTASGSRSHAEGYRTIASGDSSHAEGSNTTASGSRSHAEGDETAASGANSHAEGFGTIAIGDYSHAEGTFNAEEQAKSFSIWASNTSYSVNDIVKDNYSNTFYKCIVTHTSGVAIGQDIELRRWATYDSKNIYPAAFVIGNGTDDQHRSNAFSVNWDGSVAEGDRTTASGKNSHAEGMQTTASGYYSHAEGFSTIAGSGEAAHAEGYHTSANANHSHAEGQQSFANGTASHAEGDHTIANGYAEHVSGRYNIPDVSQIWVANRSYNVGDIVSYTVGDVTKTYRCKVANNDNEFDGNKWEEYGLYLFVIGNGTSDAHRSNAATIDWDGNAVFAGKATVGAAPVNDMDVATKKYVDDNVGGGSSVDTSTLAPKADPAFTGSISMGRDANSTAGANSVATGVNVAAEGNQSHAEGMMTKAVGENSHAEGTWTNASGGNSHAEGLYTTALGKSEHVSGQFNVLDTATAWVAGTSYNVGDVVSRVENGVTKIYRCKTANSNASWSSSNWEEYGQYLFVVGNGTDGNNRSNAFSVDWDGNATAQTSITIGNTTINEAQLQALLALLNTQNANGQSF